MVTYLCGQPLTFGNESQIRKIRELEDEKKLKENDKYISIIDEIEELQDEIEELQDEIDLLEIEKQKIKLKILSTKNVK